MLNLFNYEAVKICGMINPSNLCESLVPLKICMVDFRLKSVRLPIVSAQILCNSPHEIYAAALLKICTVAYGSKSVQLPMAQNLYSCLWLKICTAAYGSKSVQLPMAQNLYS